MSIHHITALLEFCLKNHTFFLFQGKYFEQVHGAAMGSPISPIVGNLVLEESQIKAINTATNPPKVWLSYLDDTLVIKKAEHSHQFLKNINPI